MTGRGGRLRRSAKQPQDDVNSKMRPEGAEGGSKRTPRHVGDAYQGKGEYIVKRILAQQTRNRVVYYHVEWEGIPDNTWEPVQHLGPVDGHDALKKFQDIQAEEIAQVLCLLLYASILIKKHPEQSCMFTFTGAVCKN